MRLLEKARQQIVRAIPRVPRKMPSLAQLQHIDLFLEQWEKNFVGALGAIALIAFIGIVWSVKNLNTVPVAAEGGDFQEVIVGNPRHLNPLFAATDVDRALTNIVFLPLCDIFHRGVPSLAEKCELTGEKTVTITLADRTWHDGEPVTAEDVLFTVQTMQNKTVGSPWYELARWVSVGTDSEGRVIINARQPIPELKTLVSLGVVPAHVWRDVAPQRMSTDERNLQPVGSGAFSVVAATADRDGFVQLVSLEAFEDFKPRRAYLDELVFRVAADDAEAQDLFRTRQVDALFSTDPAQTDELVKRDVHRHEITPPVVVSLFFNPLHHRGLRNRDTREAFALAVHRVDVVKHALKGNGVPLRAALPASVLKNPSALQVDTDVAAAAAFFKKNPLRGATSTLSLGIPALPTYQALANTITEQLAAVGVKVMSSVIGTGNAKDMLSHDLVLLGQDYGLAGNVASYWHSSASGVGGANYARYQIREVDGWLEQLQTDARPDERAALLEKINKRLVFDSPAVFLFQPVYHYYVSNKIKGVSTPAVGDASERFRTIGDWYVVTARARK